jgi:NAD(P)-dependent dehydrogenase (short-subunit alcohol dehydrogenase family)
VRRLPGFKCPLLGPPTIRCYRGDANPEDAYQASKAGVCVLSKSLAMQLACERIRSNAICLGIELAVDGGLLMRM